MPYQLHCLRLRARRRAFCTRRLQLSSGDLLLREVQNGCKGARGAHTLAPRHHRARKVRRIAAHLELGRAISGLGIEPSSATVRKYVELSGLWVIAAPLVPQQGLSLTQETLQPLCIRLCTAEISYIDSPPRASPLCEALLDLTLCPRGLVEHRIHDLLYSLRDHLRFRPRRPVFAPASTS